MRPIEQFIDHLKTAGASDGTIEQRSGGLRRLAEHFKTANLLTLNADQLSGYINVNKWSENYRRNTLATIRVFYHWAFVTSQLARNEAELIRTPKFRTQAPLPLLTRNQFSMRSTQPQAFETSQ